MSQQISIPLNQLPVGTEARVLRVEAKGEIRQRLLEMGFIKGTRIRVERFAPMGDPMELVIRGTHLSLRREEGACIFVAPEA